MTDFPDWEDVARDDLVLPIRGQKYRIPPLGHLDAIRIRRAQAAARSKADGDEPASDTNEPPLTDEEFFTRVLGPTLDEMRANNVPDEAIIHAAMVAHADATVGREKALYVWQKGLDPKALAADMAAIAKALELDAPTNRTTRRAAAKKTARKQPAKKTTRSPRSRSTA